MKRLSEPFDWGIEGYGYGTIYTVTGYTLHVYTYYTFFILLSDITVSDYWIGWAVYSYYFIAEL